MASSAKDDFEGKINNNNKDEVKDEDEDE
jgi:hypothetical protein